MSDIAPANAAAQLAYGTTDRPSRPAVSDPSAATDRGTDQVELSSVARLLGGLQEEGGIRQELVARIRGEIAAGTYDTPDKVEAALSGLADALG